MFGYLVGCARCWVVDLVNVLDCWLVAYLEDRLVGWLVRRFFSAVGWAVAYMLVCLVG